MGSSACYHLAKKGLSVLGIEQFSIPHEKGSHGGQSRIIRKAYFEHPDYIPLLHRAYENWKEIEERSGKKLYEETGLLYSGPGGNELMEAVRRASRIYQIPLKAYSRTELKTIFPSFNIPDEYDILFEPEAGLLYPGKCIRAYVEEALNLGATIHTNEKVKEWKIEGDQVIVITDKDQYRCKKLVITAGAWSGQMIPGINEKLKITRQVLAWVDPGIKENYALGKFPCWLIAKNGLPGCYYGFPVISKTNEEEEEGLKLAYHHPEIETDPDHVDRLVKDVELEELKNIAKEYLSVDPPKIAATKTCLYSNSPDENFIIDNLPGYENKVCIAWGFSGHGFKFVSVVGEILADLATEGKTSLPIEFLSANRF
jgi:sarcosine oxidase